MNILGILIIAASSSMIFLFIKIKYYKNSMYSFCISLSLQLFGVLAGTYLLTGNNNIIGILAVIFALIAALLYFGRIIYWIINNLLPIKKI
jgi:hypothetical protein